MATVTDGENDEQWLAPLSGDGDFQQLIVQLFDAHDDWKLSLELVNTPGQDPSSLTNHPVAPAELVLVSEAQTDFREPLATLSEQATSLSRPVAMTTPRSFDHSEEQGLDSELLPSLRKPILDETGENTNPFNIMFDSVGPTERVRMAELPIQAMASTESIARQDTGENRPKSRRILGSVKGNNRKGRAGDLRCSECRKVHLKCVFSNKGEPCRRCLTRGLECRKQYGPKRELVRLSHAVSNSSAPSVPRSPGAPDYIEMTPQEQYDILFLYNLCLPFNLKSKIVSVLKSTRGVYISDESLRLALLSSSAFEQANFHRNEVYLSKFWPTTRRIRRSNVTVDHIIAFTLMMRSVVACSSQERFECFQMIAQIVGDIVERRTILDFSLTGIEFLEFLVSFLRSAEAVMPSNEIEDATLPSVLSGSQLLNYSLPPLSSIPSDPRSQYGSEVSLLVFYVEDMRSKIRYCYKQYMQSTFAGEGIFSALNPLLSQIQERLKDIEGFPLFRDLLEMDSFLWEKSRSAGSVISPDTIASLDTKIDPLWKRSGEHLVTLTGELLEPTIPSSSSSSKQRLWFKRTTGLRRRGLYLIYLQSVILLNLMEGFVYRYSRRDGRDFAVKLITLASELNAFIEPDIPDFFSFCISLAELQLRQLDQTNDLNSALVIKQPIAFSSNVDHPDSGLLPQDQVDIVKNLLCRSENWFTFEVKRLRF